MDPSFKYNIAKVCVGTVFLIDKIGLKWKFSICTRIYYQNIAKSLFNYMHRYYILLNIFLLSLRFYCTV